MKFDVDRYWQKLREMILRVDYLPSRDDVETGLAMILYGPELAVATDDIFSRVCALRN